MRLVQYITYIFKILLIIIIYVTDNKNIYIKLQNIWFFKGKKKQKKAMKTRDILGHYEIYTTCGPCGYYKETRFLIATLFSLFK